MPYSSKNCISFKAHQIPCLKPFFSCSIQITAEQVFAPTFANNFLNTERLMIVIKFVCLNSYNCLCSVISDTAHGVGRSESEGSWNTFANSAVRECSRKSGYLFNSPLPGENGTNALAPLTALGSFVQGFGDFMQKLRQMSLSHSGKWSQLHLTHCALWDCPVCTRGTSASAVAANTQFDIPS